MLGLVKCAFFHILPHFCLAFPRQKLYLEVTYINPGGPVCLPYKQYISTTMGQQHRKETKRRRRTAYIKRQKEIAKNSKNTTPVQMAKKVSQD